MTRGTCCQENGGLADLWCVDDGDIQVSPNLGAVLPARIRRRQCKSWSHHVDDLGAAPPEWRLGGVQNMATVSTVTVGGVTLGESL